MSAKALEAAVVGVGLIGRERLKALGRLRDAGRPVRVAGVLDPGIGDAAEVAARYGTTPAGTLEELLDRRPDWVFVATPHDTAVGIVRAALERGCNVLVEKPAGRGYDEARSLAAAVKRPGQLTVGFNYRFLDGVMQACRDIQSGRLGKIVSINMVLGHGHSPEMREGSWKLDPVRAGGGCLIDPGIHLLDFCFLFCGPDVRAVAGRAYRGVWNKGIEEECHLILQAGGGTIVNLQTSIVRWRSTFGVEIHGEEGYARIEGRNRSFGPQRYVRGRRWGWKAGVSQRESEELVLESGNEDVFVKETEAVLFGMEEAVVHPCSCEESLRNMRLMDECRVVLGLPKEMGHE